jgi:uncharacterized Fe-S cluster-containing radical SAM superfamily protein
MSYQVETIKGDDPESFQKVTGASGETFKYQIQAVDAIRKAKISLSVAVMTQFVDSNKLPCRVDEEEDLIMYKSTERNMRKQGL